MSDQDTVQASDQVKPFIEKMEQKELAPLNRTGFVGESIF